MKTYISPDGEEYIEMEPGLFSLKEAVEEFPDFNNHIKWNEKFLIEDGFALKEKVEVTRLWIEAYPEVIYYLPSGSPGYKIMVTEDPIEGVRCRLVKEKECF